MKPATVAAVARLPELTVAVLRDRYQALFGEPTGTATSAETAKVRRRPR